MQTKNQNEKHEITFPLCLDEALFKEINEGNGKGKQKRPTSPG